MIKYIQTKKNPKFLVITPLREGDRISKETLKSIKRNDTSFDWIAYEGPHNIPINTTLGWKIYEGLYGKMDYIIKIDNDINADRGLLDEMYTTLERCNNEEVAYCYCPFKFIMDNGRVIDFPYREFDEERLLRANFITSNSMINARKLDEIGGFVCDSYYERLCDYALWLLFLQNFYIGTPCKKGFTTPLQEGSISARGEQDYQIKFNRVMKDFIHPLS